MDTIQSVELYLWEFAHHGNAIDRNFDVHEPEVISVEYVPTKRKRA